VNGSVGSTAQVDGQAGAIGTVYGVVRNFDNALQQCEQIVLVGNGAPDADQQLTELGRCQLVLVGRGDHEIGGLLGGFVSRRRQDGIVGLPLVTVHRLSVSRTPGCCCAARGNTAARTQDPT
jgi:hypothetical protein